MTPFQKLYVSLTQLGPALYLAISKRWWLGPVAFVAYILLSFALTFLVSLHLEGKTLRLWAWMKPPLVGFTILALGCWLF